MTERASTQTSAPWYRHPWVWGIIAIPGSSVIVGIVMITLAASGPTDLVRDDYYKAGLTINQEFGARERAAELGIEVNLVDRGAAGLLVRVDTGPGVTDLGDGGALLGELQHPTLADRDRRFELQGVAWGRWAATVDRFEGVRTLRIEAPDGSWVVQRDVRAPRPDADADAPAGAAGA
ncbi:MAG: FixH family protein [Pseudomonadales bacterium]|nr:FixH family protein [Pseudomonadales bacterium]